MVPLLSKIWIQRNVLHLLRSSRHSSELLNLIRRSFYEVFEFVGRCSILSELFEHFSKFLIFLILALQNLCQLVHCWIARICGIHSLIWKSCDRLHPWILLRIWIILSLRRRKRMIALLWVALERISNTNLRSTKIRLSRILREIVVLGRKLLSIIILRLSRLLKQQSLKIIKSIHDSTAVNCVADSSSTMSRWFHAHLARRFVRQT